MLHFFAVETVDNLFMEDLRNYFLKACTLKFPKSDPIFFKVEMRYDIYDFRIFRKNMEWNWKLYLNFRPIFSKQFYSDFSYIISEIIFLFINIYKIDIY